MKTQDCHCCEGTGREIDHIATGMEMRVIRTAKGMTMEDLGRKIKLSVPYISELERGQRRWSEDMIARFKKGCA